MKKRILVFITVAMLIFVTACGNSSGTTNQGSDGSATTDEGGGAGNEYKDVIKIGLDVDANTLDPRFSNNVTTKRATEQVFDGLIELGENLEIKPCLSESWEQKDDTTWIFHLREGVKFHDGSDLTAEDVKYTFDSVLDPNAASTVRTYYTSIDEILVLDDYTVQFNLNQPYAPLLSVMDLGILPAETGKIENFASNPIGTGPYVFKEWIKNSKIVFEANENYWENIPKTKNLEILIIPDNSTRIAALEAGDIDLIHSPLSAQDVERMENNDEFTTFKTSGLGLTFLYFNHENEILSDKAVRIGLSHMIDKESISSGIYLGLDIPATSTLLPTSWAYSDQVTGYEFDIEKGKQILADAGWKDTNGDGILDKDGKKLSIELKTHTEDPNRIQALEYIQNIFTSNGIDASVVTFDWATFSNDLDFRNYDIALAGLLNIYDPDKYLYAYFHSKGGSNRGGYNNPQLDELVQQARLVSDQDERAELYREAAQIINDEVMHNVLLYQAYVSIYTKKMEGYTPYASGFLRSTPNIQIRK